LFSELDYKFNHKIF